MTGENPHDLRSVPAGSSAEDAPGWPAARVPTGTTSAAGTGTVPGAATTAGADRWKAVFVLLLVTGSLGVAAWLLLGSRVLVVRHVEVIGTHLVPRDRVVSAARISLGASMARLNVDAVDRRVEAARGVESARIERRWPATVRITVHERVPVITVERGGRFQQLDRFGETVLDGPIRPAGLPALLTAAPGPADPATRAALDVRQSLPARYAGRLVTVEAATPESVALRLDTGKTVIWGSPERAGEKIRLLDTLLGTAAGRVARTIDVSAPEVVTTE